MTAQVIGKVGNSTPSSLRCFYTEKELGNLLPLHHGHSEEIVHTQRLNNLVNEVIFSELGGFFP